MSDFSRVSNFDPTANYKFVRVGADCPVLEIELNEMQQISEQRLQNLTKTFVGEGVKGSGSYSYEHGVLTITNEEAIVDGVPLKITTLKLNMSEGEKAYIQMWIKEVTYNDTLKYMGNVQESRTVTNKILDTNIGRETSRRMQIQYDLVKDTSQRSDLNPVNLYVGKIEGGKFILDSSLLKTFTNTKNVEKFEVTQDTTQFNTKGAYRVNSNSLQIFVDGVIQLMGYDEDYVEVNSNTFRFNSPVKKGSEVIAIYSNAVVSEERPNTHGSTHNASGDDPIDISDLADRFGVRDKLTKSSDVLEQLGHAIERGEPVAQTIEQGANKIEAENVRMEANIQTAQGVQRELKASCDLAPTKKTELDTSIQEAKHFIENLDGSQNLPQMREEITTLQNGLKSNQDLAYEGHDLKCENTLDGRIEDIVLEGMTYKNLCVKGNEKLTSFYIQRKELLFAENNKTYTVIATLSDVTIGEYQGNFNISIENEANTGQAIVQFKNGTFVTKITTSSLDNTKKVYVHFWTQGTDVGQRFTINNIIVLEGDYIQPNSYIPSYFEGIKSVGEKENKISILSKGKNLFDKNKIFKNKSIDQTSGVIYNLEGAFVSDFIELKDTIILTLGTGGDNVKRVCYFKENKQPLGTDGIYSPDAMTINVQVVEGAKYIRFQTWLESIEITQAEYGQKTTYEPYKENKKEILLPFEGGLKGLPNGAKDLIYNKDDGCYVRKKIERKILNGTENYKLRTGLTNTIAFAVTLSNKIISNNLLSNNFYAVEGIGGIDSEGLSYEGNGDLYIRVLKSKLETQDVAGFKKWLSQNPVEVYYELAEPTETKICDTKISLDTYNALTYVFSNNAISPNIKLKVASNLGSIVQQNAKSINDLYKLLEDIIIPQVTQNAYDIALLSAK